MFFWLLVYLVILAFIHSVVKVFCELKLQSLKRKGAPVEKLYKYDLKAQKEAVLNDWENIFPLLKKFRKKEKRHLFRRKV